MSDYKNKYLKYKKKYLDLKKILGGVLPCDVQPREELESEMERLESEKERNQAEIVRLQSEMKKIENIISLKNIGITVLERSIADLERDIQTNSNLQKIINLWNITLRRLQIYNLDYNGIVERNVTHRSCNLWIWNNTIADSRDIRYRNHIDIFLNNFNDILDGDDMGDIRIAIKKNNKHVETVKLGVFDMTEHLEKIGGQLAELINTNYKDNFT